VQAGARRASAAAEAGLDPRTLERWRAGAEDDERRGPRIVPRNKLSAHERQPLREDRGWYEDARADDITSWRSSVHECVGTRRAAPCPHRVARPWRPPVYRDGRRVNGRRERAAVIDDVAAERQDSTRFDVRSFASSSASRKGSRASRSRRNTGRRNAGRGSSCSTRRSSSMLGL
jgi:hypothetical protein